MSNTTLINMSINSDTESTSDPTKSVKFDTSIQEQSPRILYKTKAKTQPTPENMPPKSSDPNIANLRVKNVQNDNNDQKEQKIIDKPYITICVDTTADTESKVPHSATDKPINPPISSVQIIADTESTVPHSANDKPTEHSTKNNPIKKIHNIDNPINLIKPNKFTQEKIVLKSSLQKPQIHVQENDNNNNDNDTEIIKSSPLPSPLPLPNLLQTIIVNNPQFKEHFSAQEISIIQLYDRNQWELVLEFTNQYMHYPSYRECGTSPFLSDMKFICDLATQCDFVHKIIQWMLLKDNNTNNTDNLQKKIKKYQQIKALRQFAHELKYNKNFKPNVIDQRHTEKKEDQLSKYHHRIEQEQPSTVQLQKEREERFAKKTKKMPTYSQKHNWPHCHLYDTRIEKNDSIATNVDLIKYFVTFVMTESMFKKRFDFI